MSYLMDVIRDLGKQLRAERARADRLESQLANYTDVSNHAQPTALGALRGAQGHQIIEGEA